MNKISISTRYAKALLESAKDTITDKDELDKIAAELDSVYTYILARKEISKLMLNSSVPSDVQYSILNNLVKDLSPNKLTFGFLFILIKYRKLQLIKEIISQFKALLLKKHGLTLVKITLACNVESDCQNLIITNIESVFSIKIVANFHIDKNILAGMIIEFNSLVADFSVRSKLSRMKHAMLF